MTSVSMSTKGAQPILQEGDEIIDNEDDSNEEKVADYDHMGTDQNGASGAHRDLSDNNEEMSHSNNNQSSASHLSQNVQANSNVVDQSPVVSINFQGVPR